jgi:hypothetical protein
MYKREFIGGQKGLALKNTPTKMRFRQAEGSKDYWLKVSITPAFNATPILESPFH